jgi:hypothetical protein
MRSSCSFVTSSNGFGNESSLELRWGLLVGNPTPEYPRALEEVSSILAQLLMSASAV